MVKTQVALAIALTLPALVTASNHTCDGFDDYYAKILIFAIIGACCGIPSIVLGCMPACCGKQIEKAKLFGKIGITLGILSVIMPFIGAKVATGPVVKMVCDDKICNPNGCTDKEEEDLKSGMTALGVLVAYTVGHGYIALICGIVGVSVSAAAHCGCCKAKPDAGAPAAAVVVATPGPVAK
jgi:hypothetical protein